MTKNYILLILALMTILFYGCSRKDYLCKAKTSESIELYVAPNGSTNNPGTIQQPLPSIEDAKQKIRSIKTNGFAGKMTVWLRGGRYEIENPIVFNYHDSGSADLTIEYKAYENEIPVIDGSKILDGTWKKTDGNIWTLKVPLLHERQWWFRELYKNGARQIRSRYPNKDKWLTVKHTEPAGEFKEPLRVFFEEKIPFANLARKEAEAVMYNLWSCSRNRIEFSNENMIITRNALGWTGHGATSITKGRKVYLEHGLDFIDTAGEWYLDRDSQTLYYMAGENENPNDSTWTAPFADQLLRIKGRQEDPVRNLSFAGIKFHYTKWQLPLFGYSGLQAGFYGSKYVVQPTYGPQLAVECSYMEDCIFDNIEIAHASSAAMGLSRGCNNNTIKNSTIFDVGSGGVMIGWQRIANEPPRQWFENGWSDSLDTPKQNSVTDCHIYDCGLTSMSATGVFVAFSEDTLISHNEIHDLPYIGISVGFIWDDHPSQQKRTIVEYNHIHHCMKSVTDGAAIYTLGYQPGTLIRNNLIHDILNGHAIYTDEGSSHIVFENNVCYRMGMRGYSHNYGHHNTIRNNIFAFTGLSDQKKPWGDFKNSTFDLYHVAAEGSAVWRNRSDMDYDGSFTIENNIFYFNMGQYFMSNFAKGLKNFSMDKNIIFNPEADITSDNIDIFEGENLKKWHSRGFDVNSIVTNPMFKDIENDDFSLLPESPAFKLGFKAIDISNVGPIGNYSKRTRQ